MNENGEGESKTVWSWKGDDDQWVLYPDSVCSDLNTAEASGETSVTVNLGSGREYDIDLKKKFQINPVTKYKRKIRSQTIKTEAVKENGGTSNNGNGAEIKKEEKEETEEPEEPAPKKRRGKSETKTKAPKEEIKVEAETVKTVVMKGKAPVDAECKA